MSAFAVLFGSGCDQSLITMTGLGHVAFRDLLQPFQNMCYAFSPYSSDGRIRCMDLVAGIGVPSFNECITVPRVMSCLDEKPRLGKLDFCDIRSNKFRDGTVLALRSANINS
eukprot:IDg8416t1